MFFRSYRIYRRRRRTSPRRSSRRKDYLARKEAARVLAVERLGHFAARYAEIDPALGAAMQYKRLAIRDTRSRWGSCSSRKNLNFNYRILDLPPELRDYVIVHELCHLKELHHGRAFWDLMELTVPKAREFHRQARTIRLG